MDASCAYDSRSPCVRDRSCYWFDNECKEVVKNIWYDREGQQTGGKDKILHIYGATIEFKPVLMVNHGINGEAENLRSTALRFVEQGYLVVAPTLGTFSAIKRAFSWIKNNVEDYGGDMNRFSCHGYSAGGFRFWNLLTSTADGSNGCAGRGQIAAQGGKTLEQCKTFCEGEGAVFLQSHEYGWCSCFSECALTRPASDYNSAADVYELLQDPASEEEEITQDDEVTQDEFFLVDYNAHTEGNMMRIYLGSGSQEVKPALLVLPRKNNFDDMCGTLANEGFLVMCPQWSRYNDVRRSLSWARNNLRAFNGDKDRFGLLSIEDATEHAIREVYRLSPDIFKALVFQKGLKDSSIDRVQKTIGSTLIIGTQHSRYFAFKQALEDQNTDVELLLENDFNAEELENEIKSFFQNGL